LKSATSVLGAIVSEVISVVGHVRAAIERVETTIVRTTSDSDQHAANVIVPRVVTPQYVRASCAPNARNASLGSALQFLDAGMSERGAIRLTVHCNSKLARRERNPSASQKQKINIFRYEGRNTRRRIC
jgi:hypothetical protein